MAENYQTDLRNRLSQISNMGTSATNFAGQIAQKQDDYNQQQAQQRQQQLAATAQQQWQASQAKLLQQQQAQYLQQIKQQQMSMPQPQAQASPVEGAPVSNTYTGAPGNNFQNFLHAISGRESGGNYKAVNKDSGALGKYQVMPGNVASWTKMATGKSYTPQQYLASPQLQEQTAQHMLQGYYNKYGPAGAAVAWYAGEGTAGKYLKNPAAYNAPQGAYSSINAYALGILKSMGLRK